MISSPAFAGEGDHPEGGGGAPPSGLRPTTSPLDRGEENPHLPAVDIFTDGACRGNPGPGGWAALIRSGGREKEISGGERLTTNNRMELMAAIKALEALKKPCRVHLYTDSAYVRDGITKWIHGWRRNGWRTADKKPVKNAELWQELLDACSPHRVEFHWVKAHNGHVDNERVDALACAAADAMRG